MTYNSVGMIVERVEKRLNETNTFTYTYDNANQLVEVFKNGTIINSYTYDDNGNRLSETTPNGVVNGRYDNQDRMSAYGSNVYSYTDRGSLKQKITSEGTTTYNYDFQGNLLNVTTPAKQIEYIVDARNRRIAKKVNGTVVQKFLYLNQLEPIAELDANDNIISLFVYGTRSNTPEYIIKGGVKYKVITNQLGSVIMVVNVSSGEIVQSIEYDSFGNILSDSNPNFQPFTLAGGIYDNDTKLTRFGARDYDAREGRWTSKDPIKFDGGRNFYVYALNNPIILIDKTGLEPDNPFYGLSIDPIANAGSFIDFQQTTAVLAMKAFYDNLGNPITYTKCQALKKFVEFEKSNGKLGLMSFGSPYSFISIDSSLLALNSYDYQTDYGDKVDLDWMMRIAPFGVAGGFILAYNTYAIAKSIWTVVRWPFLGWHPSNQVELNSIKLLFYWLYSNNSLEDFFQQELCGCE